MKVEEKLGKFAEIRNYFEPDSILLEDVPVKKLIAFYEKAIVRAAKKSQLATLHYNEPDAKTEAIIAEAVVTTVEHILAALKRQTSDGDITESSNIEYVEFC
jgi:hypothetical protein